MRLHPETLEQQQLLAKYCKTGVIPKGIKADLKRLPHYRRLVYNVIFDTLSSAYPITKTFLGDEKWKLLVDDYFKIHSSKHAQIWQMPLGLFDYLSESPSPHAAEFPFLPELVYFEWLEIELYAEKDLPRPKKPSIPKKVSINPHHRIAQLSFPFHKVSVKEAVQNPKTSYVLLFRNLENFKIEFTEVSEIVALVIQSLADCEYDLLTAMKKVGANYAITDEQFLVKQSNELFNQFKRQGLFL